MMAHFQVECHARFVALHVRYAAHPVDQTVTGRKNEHYLYEQFDAAIDFR